MFRRLSTCTALLYLAGLVHGLATSETRATFQLLFVNKYYSGAPPELTLAASSHGGTTFAGYNGYLGHKGPFLFADGKLRGLGSLDGSTEGMALAISAGGGVIVGYSGSAEIDFDGNLELYGGLSEDITTQGGAFRWTVSSGMQPLFIPPNRASVATGVSADGSVIAGYFDLPGSSSQYPERGFRWTATGSIQLDPPTPYMRAFVSAISADGSTTIGTCYTGFANTKYEACLWTADGTAHLLGFLHGPAGNYPLHYSSATAVSVDGSVVIGEGVPRYGWVKTFLWTAKDGIRGIANGTPTGLSADGTVVVGNNEGQPFRWDALRGQQNLANVLTNAGVDLGNVELDSVTGISPDGKTFFGTGSYRSSFSRSISVITIGGDASLVWTATLPDPAPVIDPKIKSTPLAGSSARVIVWGTAQGRITKVTYRVNGQGAFRKAIGKHIWLFTPRLNPGHNEITLIAQGPGGRSATVKTDIVRP